MGIPELDTKDGRALRTPRAWTSFYSTTDRECVQQRSLIQPVESEADPSSD